MSREIANRIEFTVMCISNFSAMHKLSQKDAYVYLKTFGGISYLKDCYDAAHLQSIRDTIEDLTILCHRNGGQIA